MKQAGDESRFQLMERLGRGGTAEVFRVRLGTSRREAALKRPLPEPDAGIDFNLLASRELTLIGSLRFPGLVRILNGPDDSTDYLLLEVCEGKTLDQLGRITDLTLSLNLLSAIASDLEYLRQHKIIHGDLKPQNTFLPTDLTRCLTDKLFFAKLSDFSLGRFEHEADSVRAGLGTVGYMAPETIIDGRASYQSDLFAFGVIAYQMLTGRHPFIESESDPMRINAKVREEQPVPLEQIRPDLPKGLVELVVTLLHKSPEKRPQSPLAVCRTLRLLGAIYPFEKLLRTKYLLERYPDYDTAISRLNGISPKQQNQLTLQTARSSKNLRLVLEINQRKAITTLSESGIGLAGNVYWPSKLRRAVLRGYSIQPLSQRKVAVREACVALPGSSPLSDLLLPQLRTATIRRHAAAVAPDVESRENYCHAVTLYLRSGNLEAADRCAYQAASLLRGEHRAKDAILCLNSVLDFAALTGKTVEIRELLMLRGDIQKETGEVDDALATYQQLISLYRDLPSDKLLAETYRDLGDLYKMKQDSKSGLHALNQAVAIYQQMGEEFELSRTYNNIGNSYFYAGDVANTLRYYRSALRIQRRLNAPTEIASTLSNMASVYCMKGNLNRGIFLLERSLQLKKELGDAGEIARSLNNLGYAYFLKRDFSQSKSSLMESLDLNTRIGSKKEILFNLENLTATLQEAGEFSDSLRFLEQGIELSAELNDRVHQLVFGHAVATTNLRLGKPTECARALETILTINEGVDDPLLFAQARITSVHLRLLIGDMAGALKLARDAVAFAESKATKPAVLQALVTMMRTTEDPTFMDRISVLAQELDQPLEIIVAHFNCVEYLLDTGRLQSPKGHIGDLMTGMHSLRQSVDRPRLRGILAELLCAANMLQEARLLIDENLTEARQFGLNPEYARSLVLAGQLQVFDGDLEKAYANYRRALQILKLISDSLQMDSDRATFQSSRVVQFLVAEIRRLSAVLVQKQRAGSPALR